MKQYITHNFCLFVLLLLLIGILLFNKDSNYKWLGNQREGMEHHRDGGSLVDRGVGASPPAAVGATKTLPEGCNTDTLTTCSTINNVSYECAKKLCSQQNNKNNCSDECGPLFEECIGSCFERNVFFGGVDGDTALNTNGRDNKSSENECKSAHENSGKKTYTAMCFDRAGNGNKCKEPITDAEAPYVNDVFLNKKCFEFFETETGINKHGRHMWCAKRMEYKKNKSEDCTKFQDSVLINLVSPYNSRKCDLIPLMKHECAKKLCGTANFGCASDCASIGCGEFESGTMAGAGMQASEQREAPEHLSDYYDMYSAQRKSPIDLIFDNYNIEEITAKNGAEWHGRINIDDIKKHLIKKHKDKETDVIFPYGNDKGIINSLLQQSMILPHNTLTLYEDNDHNLSLMNRRQSPAYEIILTQK